MVDVTGPATASHRDHRRPARIDRRTMLAGCMALSLRGRSACADAPPAGDLDRQIGTMLMMGFRGAASGDQGVRVTMARLASGQIGGVLLFEDNLRSPGEARTLIDGFRSAARAIKPLIAVDQEGGLVSRLRPDLGFRPLPSAREVGLMPPAEAAGLYDATARDLRDLGINLNFAPVVDLDINPRNPIIGSLSRSFGVDPDRVVERAKIFIDAHRRYHILTALKHFPGHGSSVQDSHLALPDITETWRDTELKPFAAPPALRASLSLA